MIDPNFSSSPNSDRKVPSRTFSRPVQKYARINPRQEKRMRQSYNRRTDRWTNSTSPILTSRSVPAVNICSALFRPHIHRPSIHPRPLLPAIRQSTFPSQVPAITNSNPLPCIPRIPWFTLASDIDRSLIDLGRSQLLHHQHQSTSDRFFEFATPNPYLHLGPSKNPRHSTYSTKSHHTIPIRVDSCEFVVFPSACNNQL